MFVFMLFFSNGHDGHLHKFEIVPFKTATYSKHSGTKLDQFQPIVPEI